MKKKIVCIKSSGMYKQCLLVIISLVFISATFSQKLRSNAVAYWNNELSKIAFIPKAAGWYNFRPGIIKNSKEFFSQYKSLMGLKDDDDMKLVRTDGDGVMQHHRFQQYYKGIKIEGAEFIIHEKDEYANSGNGKLVHDMNKSIQPLISEAAALNKALDIVPSSKYKLKSNDVNNLTSTQYHPKSELVFQKSNPDILFTPENFKLCFHFDIYIPNRDGFSVYINANDGTLVSKSPLQSDCSGTTINTNFYGNRTIYTTYNSSDNKYHLQDNCISTVITVYNNQDSESYLTNEPYINASNTAWSSTIDLQSASTSLWACRRAVDFYQAVFNRNGFDDNGADVNIYQNATVNGSPVNASMSFGGGNLKIGNNSNIAAAYNKDDWNAIDIIGHEFTHAVTAATSALTYHGESGALNESFSDIFGTYVEWWDGSTPFDWTIGEDRIDNLNPNLVPLRDMSNPKSAKSSPQPDTYKGAYWIDTSGNYDYGGVHINSGVQNHWFYLLSAGGSGVNDNGTSFNVTGVGIQVAGFVAYQMDAHYLTSAADYADARYASVEIAVAYYGYCSNVSQQVVNAWNAVGVSNSTAIDNTSGNFGAGCGTYNSGSSFISFSSATTLNVAQSCTVTLNPSTLPYGYSLSAGNTVILYPGFSSLEGSNTDIFIQSCDLESSPASQSNRQIAESAIQNNKLQSTDKISGLNVYPNPTTSIIHLDFTADVNENNAVIQVFNMEMQKVQELRLGDLIKGRQNKTVDLGKQASGVYYVIIQLSNKKLTAKVSLLK